MSAAGFGINPTGTGTGTDKTGANETGATTGIISLL